MPIAKMMMDGVEGSNRVIDDGLFEAFVVRQMRSQNNQLSQFSRQLAYMLAQITVWRKSIMLRHQAPYMGIKIASFAVWFTAICAAAAARNDYNWLVWRPS